MNFEIVKSNIIALDINELAEDLIDRFKVEAHEYMGDLIYDELDKKELEMCDLGNEVIARITTEIMKEVVIKIINNYM